VWKDIHPLFPELNQARVAHGDGFWLKTARHGSAKYWLIIGANERGVLYGTFALLERIAQQKDVSTLDDSQTPSAPIRWVSEWDNLDGSIERGYAGPSIFFDQNAVAGDLTRAGEYARLLASVGINAGQPFVRTVSETGLSMLFIGVAVLLTTVIIVLLVGYYLLKIPFDDLLGVASGATGNPAILVYSARMAPTERPDIGYAMIFPSMTIVKVIAVQIIGLLVAGGAS